MGYCPPGKAAVGSWLRELLAKLLAKATGGWLDLAPAGRVLTVPPGQADSAHAPGSSGGTATLECQESYGPSPEIKVHVHTPSPGGHAGGRYPPPPAATQLLDGSCQKMLLRAPDSRRPGQPASSVNWLLREGRKPDLGLDTPLCVLSVRGGGRRNTRWGEPGVGGQEVEGTGSLEWAPARKAGCGQEPVGEGQGGVLAGRREAWAPGQRPAHRASAQPTNPPGLWKNLVLGSGHGSTRSPAHQESTLMPKCLRSCSRNTNVSTVWGMRRMPAGTRPWAETGGQEVKRARRARPQP